MIEKELIRIMKLKCDLNYLRMRILFEVAPGSPKMDATRGGGIGDPTYSAALSVGYLIDRLVDTDLEYKRRTQAIDLRLMAIDNPETRELIRLHYFQAMPWSDVAETLKIPIATIYRRRRNAIKKLNYENKS